MITEVRKLTNAPNNSRAPPKIKVEPGTSSLKAGPPPKRRQKASGSALPKRAHPILNPEPSSTSVAGMSAQPVVADRFPATDYRALHAELDEVDNLLRMLPNGPTGPPAPNMAMEMPSIASDNDMPPAYAPPAKSIEQIIQEANAALEERIYTRISKDIAKTGNKRSRAVMTLDQAEDNLRQASSDYAKAKATEERKAAAKQRKGNGGGGSGKKEDDADSVSNAWKGGKRDRGEKGGYDW